MTNLCHSIQVRQWRRETGRMAYELLEANHLCRSSIYQVRGHGRRVDLSIKDKRGEGVSRGRITALEQPLERGITWTPS